MSVPRYSVGTVVARKDTPHKAIGTVVEMFSYATGWMMVQSEDGRRHRINPVEVVECRNVQDELNARPLDELNAPPAKPNVTQIPNRKEEIVTLEGDETIDELREQQAELRKQLAKVNKEIGNKKKES